MQITKQKKAGVATLTDFRITRDKKGHYIITWFHSSKPKIVFAGQKSFKLHEVKLDITEKKRQTSL